jgi:hypothetical protein
VSDINIAVADSLKVLDLKRPIREADLAAKTGPLLPRRKISWKRRSEFAKPNGPSLLDDIGCRTVVCPIGADDNCPPSTSGIVRSLSAIVRIL